MANITVNQPDLYDRVIGSIVTNVMIERARDKEQKIILKRFNPDDESHRLYFNCAMITSCLNGNEPVYISPIGEDTFESWWTYIKLWWKKKNWRRQMRFMKKATADEHDAIPVEAMVEYVRSSFDITEKAFNRINEQLYGW